MAAKRKPAQDAVAAMVAGKGAKLREAFGRARNPKPLIAALAKRALNDRVDRRIGAALVEAWDLILSQPFDEGVKDLLPAMAIGAVHQKHAKKKDTSAMIAKLVPLVAKSYFEAELIGAWAFGLKDDKEYAESQDLVEIAIACPKMKEWQHYCFALWIIQESNTKIPLDRARAKRFLDACLPRADMHPAILHNAACVFAELDDVDNVLAQVRELKSRGYDEMPAVRKDCVDLLPSIAGRSDFEGFF
jgi:hypothetical protein